MRNITAGWLAALKPEKIKKVVQSRSLKLFVTVSLLGFLIRATSKVGVGETEATRDTGYLGQVALLTHASSENYEIHTFCASTIY